MSASDLPQRHKSTAQEEVRLMGGLKRIAKLNLEENKSDLLKDSVFGDLSKITNPKESSSLLLTPLYRSYDADKGVFVFNDEASFSFCSKDIAEVTGMRDSGISLKEYEEGLSSSPHFPSYLFKLRGESVSGAKGKILANHIRAMLMGMSVDDDERKLIFKKLMIFYLMEEVLLCEANSSRVPRAKTWQLVEDIEKCETVNWPKAIEQHLRGALVGCKDWDKNGCIGEHSFEGPMPVLEVVIYNRIREIQPKLSDKESQESPPIQKYKGQRVKDLDIVLKALKASDIDPCSHCTSRSQDSGRQDSGSPDSGSSSSVQNAEAEFANLSLARDADKDAGPIQRPRRVTEKPRKYKDYV